MFGLNPNASSMSKSNGFPPHRSSTVFHSEFANAGDSLANRPFCRHASPNFGPRDVDGAKAFRDSIESTMAAHSRGERTSSTTRISFVKTCRTAHFLLCDFDDDDD